MENKERQYICICGKEFLSKESYAGHSTHCKEKQLQKHGTLEIYKENCRKRTELYQKHCEIQRNIHLEQQLNQWISEKHRCQRCGEIMTEYFGSGKFCSRKCASTRIFSEEDKMKLSESVKKVNQNLDDYPKRKEYLHQLKLKKDSSFVKVGSIKLDITVSELETYRKKQTECEICGRSTKRDGTVQTLVIDHNHKTDKFRGLLCSSCNMNLGWFEKNSKNILKYLEKI